MIFISSRKFDTTNLTYHCLFPKAIGIREKRRTNNAPATHISDLFFYIIQLPRQCMDVCQIILGI
jgi:hypothetical protein